MEEILTPVPYQRNGSHVNGGDSNLIVSQEQNEDLNEDWVGSTDLASYLNYSFLNNRFDINVPQQANKQRKRVIMCCTTNFSIQVFSKLFLLISVYFITNGVSSSLCRRQTYNKIENLDKEVFYLFSVY